MSEYLPAKFMNYTLTEFKSKAKLRKEKEDAEAAWREVRRHLGKLTVEIMAVREELVRMRGIRPDGPFGTKNALDAAKAIAAQCIERIDKITGEQ